MEIFEFIETLDREGRRVADVAAKAGVDAEMPTCPNWQVRDLLRHLGVVHRWAAGFVHDAVTTPSRPPQEPTLDGDPLVDWYRAGHRTLVETLTAAPADVDCWSFLPAPSPLAFWARRQAHETTIHRVDVEAARGCAPSAIDARFAVDGIDELLCGFHARERSRVRTAVPRALRLHTTDTDTVWTVHLSDDAPRAVRDAERDADYELGGTAMDLYLTLWNRPPAGVVTATGDTEVGRLWRETSAL